MTWQELFDIVYHPGADEWIAHWKESSLPVGLDHKFLWRGQAIEWIAQNWQKLVDEELEKEML